LDHYQEIETFDLAILTLIPKEAIGEQNRVGRFYGGLPDYKEPVF